VSNNTSTNRCPSCGKKVEPASICCQYCGVNLVNTESNRETQIQQQFPLDTSYDKRYEQIPKPPPPPDLNYPYSVNPYAAPQSVGFRRNNSRIAVLITIVLIIILASSFLLIDPIKGIFSQTKGSITPTVTLTKTPQQVYNQVTSSTPTIEDSLAVQNSSYNWDLFPPQTGQPLSCQFSSGGYEVIDTQKGTYSGCYANSINVKDFALSIQVTLETGDAAVILFRASGGKNEYRWGLYQRNYDLYGYNDTFLTKNGSYGLTIGQTSTLIVIAKGGTFWLYKDGKFLEKIEEKQVSTSSGKIGFGVFDNSGGTKVIYKNLEIWNL
jgi:hypothetical protein